MARPRLDPKIEAAREIARWSQAQLLREREAARARIEMLRREVREAQLRERQAEEGFFVALGFLADFL